MHCSSGHVIHRSDPPSIDCSNTQRVWDVWDEKSKLAHSKRGKVLLEPPCMSGVFAGQREAHTVSRKAFGRCMRYIGPRSWLRLRALGCITEAQYSLLSQKCSSAQRSVRATARSWSSSGDVLCTSSTGSLQASFRAAHRPGPTRAPNCKRAAYRGQRSRRRTFRRPAPRARAAQPGQL